MPPLPPASLLAALDQRLSNALYKRGCAVPRSLYKLLEHSGDGIFWLAAAVAAAAAPSLPLGARVAALNLLLGLLVDLVLVGSAKALARRQRPVYNQQADFVVVVAVDKFSFPSGHSARVSFVAAFVSGLAGPLGAALAPTVAAWALVTALSRAAMGRHYLGDVLAGLLLGCLTAALATRGQYAEAGWWLDERAVQRIDSSWTGAMLLRALQAAKEGSANWWGLHP